MWAENAIILVSKHTPDDYVLPWTMNRTTGVPFGPRGVLHSLLSGLTVNDAYNGLIPPSWARGSYQVKQSQDWDNAATFEDQADEETDEERCGVEDQYYMDF